MQWSVDMISNSSNVVRQLPKHTLRVFREKRHNICLTIPVLNEGERIRRQLEAIRSLDLPVDIVICDGGSVDGCTNDDMLSALGVSALIVKQGEGRMSSQLRLLFDFALNKGYSNVVNMDGNEKDDPGSIPNIINALNEGYDLVLGSRFIEGGSHRNTPLERSLAIKCLHAPIMSFATGFRMTDTTNSFRGFNAAMLSDSRMAIFRDVFSSYNLPYYISFRAAQLGYRLKEVPVNRVYPDDGSVPSKIKGWRGKVGIMKELLMTVTGSYNP